MLLEGVTVLEVGNGVPAGYCGRVLRSLGADVLKVEAADGLDPVRGYGLPCRVHAPLSCAYCHLNGAKSRLILSDGAAEKQISLLCTLLPSGDAVVLGDGPLAGAFAEAMRSNALPAVNTVRLVGAVDVAAVGELPADETAGVAAGLRDPYGNDSPPEGLRLDIAEVNAGAHAAAVVTLALARSEDSAAPIFLDVGVFNAAFSMIEIAAQTVLLSEQFDAGFPDLVGSPLGPPYLCRDGGQIVINIYGRGVWARTCRAIGRPDLEHDERFVETFAMYHHAEALRELLDGWCATLDRDDAIAALRAERIPSAPILAPAELPSEPQLSARGLFVRDGDPRIASCYVISRERNPLTHVSAAETGVLLAALGVRAAFTTQPEVDGDAVVVDLR